MLGLALLGGNHRRPPLRWLILLALLSYFDGYDWDLVEGVIALALPMVLACWRAVSGDSYEQYVLGNYSYNR